MSDRRQRSPVLGDPAEDRPALRLMAGGVTNSRLTAKSGREHPARPRFGADACGVDTVRYRYRVPPEVPVLDEFRRAHAPVAMHARGELRRSYGSVRVGAYPGGLVYVEGRLAALLHGDDDHRLLGTDALEAGALRGAALARTVPDGSVVGIGRADLSAELRFEDPRDGLALLRAAALVDLPWLKAGTEGQRRDATETVYWRNLRGRSTVLRLYDKGVETETADPGHWLRLERQSRYRKEREMTVETYASLNHRDLYIGRELRALAEGDDSLSVCTTWDAAERLSDLAAAGAITPAAADRLIGFVYRRGAGHPVRTARRHWSELRRLGITLDSLTPERETVPIGEYVRELADSWVA